MAYRVFSKAVGGRFLAGGATLAATGYYATQRIVYAEEVLTPAEQQFLTPFGFYTARGAGMTGPYQIKEPLDRKGPWFQIKNNYPKSSELNPASVPTLPDRGVPGDFLKKEAPWLDICFRTNPELFCQTIKAYCWEGNVNHSFKIQNNRVREWYHAPWMHYSQNGREPVSGLTFERPTPAGELASTQNRILQCWAIGFYNKIGATVFGDMWRDPNNPDWKKNKLFPEGTCVFKILLTDATDEELPFMVGSPSLPACIAEQPTEDFLTKSKGSAPPRNDFTSKVRLVQVDFAVRDDRAEIGWVFGTFMYDSRVKADNPWDRIIPVGIQWGNDPEIDEKAYKEGKRPHQLWINPVADRLRVALGGERAEKGWGWNGRMNGPADNYISACASCHSTSQKNTAVDMVPDGMMNPMEWFRNIPAGQPWSKGDIAGDYSLQLMMGYANFKAWEKVNRPQLSRLWYSAKYAVPFSKTRKESDAIDQKRENLRR